MKSFPMLCQDHYGDDVFLFSDSQIIPKVLTTQMFIFFEAIN